MELVTDKIEVNNGKIYLYGTGFEYKQYGSFLVNRIKKIDEIKTEKTMPDGLVEVEVVYEIYHTGDFQPETYEKVIKKDNDKLTIEAKTSNTFLLTQRLLSFGNNCKIVSPEDFKNEFVTLLKDMKAGYCCD